MRKRKVRKISALKKLFTQLLSKNKPSLNPQKFQSKMRHSSYYSYSESEEKIQILESSDSEININNDIDGE